MPPKHQITQRFNFQVVYLVRLSVLVARNIVFGVDLNLKPETLNFEL